MRFRNLIDMLPEPVFEVDSRGRITFANPKALELTGYTIQDIETGLNALDFISFPQKSAAESNIRKLLHGNKIGPNEYRIRRKDGSDFWALVHSTPVISRSGLFGFTGIIFDISDRKRSEEELELKSRQLIKLLEQSGTIIYKKTQDLETEIGRRRKAEHELIKSEILYQTLVNSAKDVIWTTDLNLRYTFVSPSVFRQLGYTVQEIMRSDPSDNISEQFKERLTRGLERELSAVEISTEHADLDMTEQIERFRKDGSKIWVEVTCTFLRNEDGVPVGILGISRDISSRKKVEEILRTAHYDLEQQVKDRTADFERANGKLRQEMDERKQVEIALRESEERFRNIFETTLDCIFIKDKNLRFTQVNPAMLNKLGASGTEILGKTDKDVFSAAYAKQSRWVETKALQGETVETQQNLQVGGQMCIFNIIRSPLKDALGRIIGVFGVARDLTEREFGRSQFKLSPDQYVSKAMRNALYQTYLAAKSESPVLFLGESGTGKDYLARYLHEISSRAAGPFILVNCAALPEQLVEAELFGHERGAFTGSGGRKRGLVELAESGSLLLNEIGEMPVNIQAKLLAFLDNQTFIRVGGERQVSVDCRVMAATNRDLVTDIQTGNFREDLYYRLNVFSVNVPPLRARLEDLPILVGQLLEFLSTKMGYLKAPGVHKRAMDVMKRYSWPGNIRELRNVLERALILSDRGAQIDLQHLNLSDRLAPHSETPVSPQITVTVCDELSFAEKISMIKKTLIEEALVQSGGGIKKAATILGMTRYALIHQMKSLGIHRYFF